MKQAFRLSGARAVVMCALALSLVFGALISARAQGVAPTPDTFIAQITSANNVNSFAFGVSGNGRFVVIESTANLAPSDPLRPDTVSPNNADGNREIFLFDYAQRRIFQITNTFNAPKDATKPSVSPATPNDFSNVDVEVSNNRPVISYDGKWIVFASNAYSDAAPGVNPKGFNGLNHVAALKADGNQELFLYRIPDVADADLTGGAEVPFADLSAGSITRLTNTPASRLPQPGTATSAPDVIDDNRFPAINDDGTIIAFVSTRNLSTVNGGTNADANAEIFVYNRTSNAFSQITKTTNPSAAINNVFSANPSLSGDGSTIAFFSSADFGTSPAEAEADRGNGEIYVANYNGTDIANLRQVTRTPKDNVTGVPANIFSFGRRLSRNGNLLAFETRANLTSTGASNGALTNFFGTYIFRLSDGALRQVGPRATSGSDVVRFPTFTGDNSTIVFASALNFLPSGSVPTTASEGLNAAGRNQIFAAPVSAFFEASLPTNTFSRLTNVPSTQALSDVAPFPAETLRRLAFSYRTELGGGNSDTGGNQAEAFYMLVPPVTGETPASAAAAVSYFTGASNRPVVSASPVPSPSPVDAVTGLAPSMLSTARSTTVALASSTREVDKNSSQDGRRPQLPIELGGVSVSINRAAAGLYFVSPTEINFVVPAGLAPSATEYPVVINNNGAVIRSTLLINPAQPDIFTSTNGAGGRAAVLNVTNQCVTPSMEPPGGFPVTTTRPKDNVCTATETETVPTELLIMLTGVGNSTTSQITVNIKGAKDVNISGASIVSVTQSRTAGFQQIVVRLPADLAGSGDSTILVTIANNGTFTSRPVATAPLVRIQ